MFPGPVCISLTPNRIGDVFAADLEGADCVEVRLDYLEDPSDALETRWDRLARPVIATCRRAACGGRFEGSLDDELRILGRAVENGARWVDLDYRFVRPFPGADVIASYHDFEGTPPDLDGLTRRISGSGGSVAKVAVTTRTWSEVARVLELPSRVGFRPLIAIGMGMTGEITRVLGPSRGSALTYASSGRASAPGQIPVSELLDTFRFRQIRSTTPVLGVVGNPVGHSTSPDLHNRALGEAGLDFVYLRLPVVSLEDFFANAVDLGIVGFSVTIPHKVGVLRFLDEVSPEAEAVGAVNTVTRAMGKWVGDNTDVHGIRASLRGLDLARMRVVVLGTGGAARAAVAALRDARSVTVLSRGASPGTREWARRVEIDRLDRYGKYEADLLINATPVGMSPNVDATPVEGPIRAPYVFDMIYNPERTRLLRDAEAQGLRTMSGRTMFMAQAARQFEIWTGRPASPGLFSGAA
jgi:3-dehydroquinate dehydratase/shikimate dehydrogenase